MSVFTVKNIITEIINKHCIYQETIKVLRLNKTCYDTARLSNIWQKFTGLRIGDFLEQNLGKYFYKNRILNDVDYDDSYCNYFHIVRLQTRIKISCLPAYINATADELTGLFYLEKYIAGFSNNDWRDAILQHAEICDLLRRIPEYLLNKIYIVHLDFSRVYFNIDELAGYYWLEYDYDENNTVKTLIADKTSLIEDALEKNNAKEKIKELNNDPNFTIVKKMFNTINFVLFNI